MYAYLFFEKYKKILFFTVLFNFYRKPAPNYDGDCILRPLYCNVPTVQVRGGKLAYVLSSSGGMKSDLLEVAQKPVQNGTLDILLII
jgi:hypothetical protein